MNNPYDMADFVSKTITNLDDDEVRLLNKVKEIHYWGNTISVFELHDLTILFYQAQGFARSQNLST